MNEHEFKIYVKGIQEGINISMKICEEYDAYVCEATGKGMIDDKEWNKPVKWINDEPREITNWQEEFGD